MLSSVPVQAGIQKRCRCRTSGSSNSRGQGRTHFGETLQPCVIGFLSSRHIQLLMLIHSQYTDLHPFSRATSLFCVLFHLCSRKTDEVSSCDAAMQLMVLDSSHVGLGLDAEGFGKGYLQSGCCNKTIAASTKPAQTPLSLRPSIVPPTTIILPSLT